MSSIESSHTGPREWNAEVYHRVGQPQFEWAQEVLARLPLRGDETVLDAGCGSGRVTALLAERLPRGRVIAVDASESMVAKARETLGPGADVRLASLTELGLPEPVDAVFSSAVFHWIEDHDLLFARLHSALKPGGPLVAQCGGEGNVDALVQVIRTVSGREPFSAHFAGFAGTWNFAGVEETERRLRDAGFEAVRCWTETKPVVPEQPLDFLATVTLGPHLARLPEELQDRFVDAVAERMGSPLRLDYVRLNIEASA